MVKLTIYQLGKEGITEKGAENKNEDRKELQILVCDGLTGLIR